MPNVFNTVPAEPRANVFDSIPTGNVFDTIPAYDPAKIQTAPVNQPSQFSSGLPASVPASDNPDFAFTRALTAPGTGLVSQIGKGLEREGAAIPATLADIGTTLTGQTPAGESRLRNLKAVMTDQPVPYDQEMKAMPATARMVESGIAGLAKTAPQMAAFAADPMLGVAAFGATPQGFDAKQAAIAAILPVVGKYSGAITEAIASKAGVSSDTALAALNRLGGATGATGLLSADQLHAIYQLPEAQRKDALIDAVGNVGSMFLLGAAGERHQLEGQSINAAVKASAQDAALQASLPPGFIPREAFINPTPAKVESQPAAAVESKNPFDVAEQQMATPVNTTAATPAAEVVGEIKKNVVPPVAPNGNVVRAPDPVQTALNKLRSESKGTASASGGEPINTPVIGEQTPPAPPADVKPEHIAEAESLIDAQASTGALTPGEALVMKADIRRQAAKTEAPAAPVNADDLQAAMRGNQLKPTGKESLQVQTSEPAKTLPSEKPSPPEAATAPAAPAASLDIPAMENELASRLKNNGQVASGDFTIEGIKKAMGLPEEKQGDATRIEPMIDAGLIERTPEGLYRFNENIQRKGTLKPLSQPEVAKSAPVVEPPKETMATASPPEQITAPFKVGDKVIHDGVVKTVTRAIPGADYIGVGNRAVKVSELKPAPAGSVKTTPAGKFRDDAALFDKLVRDFGPQNDWASGDEGVYDPTLKTSNGAGSSVPARIKMSDDMAAMRRRAASDFLKPEERSQIETPQGRAALLPRLVQHLQAAHPGDTELAKTLALHEFSRKESPLDEKASQERQATDTRILAGIQARLQKHVPELTGLQVADHPQSAGRRSLAPERHDGSGVFQLLPAPLQDQLEKLLGHRIIVVEHPDGVPFNGYKVDGQKVILVAKDSHAPILSAVMHEGIHAIQTTSPGLFDSMVADLLPLMQNQEKYRARLKRLKYDSGDKVSDKTLHAELIADFLGDQAAKPEFWADMAQRDPQLFKRVARHVKAMLDKVLDFIRSKGVKEFGAEQYFSDVQKARAMVADALVKFGRENVTGIREANRFGDVNKTFDRFSKKNEDDRVNSDKPAGSKDQSVQPPTSQGAEPVNKFKESDLAEDPIDWRRPTKLDPYHRPIWERDANGQLLAQKVEPRNLQATDFPNPDVIPDSRTQFKVGDYGLFYRAGTPPESGYSFNYKDQHSEKGISAYSIPSASSFAGLKSADWYLTFGKVVARGSDGEPVIESGTKWHKFRKADSKASKEILAAKFFNDAIKKNKLTELFKNNASHVLTALREKRTLDKKEVENFNNSRSDSAAQFSRKPTGEGDFFNAPEAKLVRVGFVPPKFDIKKPIEGPTGAKIVGYEWKSKMGDKWHSGKQEYIEARVSDWDSKETSTGTGRDIVHTFYVKHPAGNITVEGIRSAQNILGISETRLQTIAKHEQAAQAYQEQQLQAELAVYDKAAKGTPADAARDYRTTNYSPFRTFEENNAVFNESLLLEKNGKYFRASPRRADLMQQHGWKLVENDPAKSSLKLNAPESVDQQKARLADEKRQTDTTKVKAAMQDKAQARLTGADIDTTGDIFAADRTSRVDKAGQGSLFSNKDAASEYLGGEDGKPRQYDQVKSDFADAEANLKMATVRGDTKTQSQKEYQQQAALAAARYRTARDELKLHPERVAEVLKETQRLSAAAKAAREAGNPDWARSLEDELQTHIDDLDRLPSKLVERIRDELTAKGELPKMQELKPNAGRTLQAMTDALNRKVAFDSPTRSFIDRLEIAKKAAETYTAGKDFTRKAWGNSVAASKALWSIFKSAPISEDFKNVMKSWIGYDTRTSIENARYAKAITERVKEKSRRMAISVWLDADGDVSLLKFQRDAVPDKYREVWNTALNLTEDEKQLAKDIKANFGEKLDDGMAVGIIGKGREDYGVPQRWKVAPQIEAGDISGEKHGKPGNPYAKLDPRDPFFSFQRTTPGYFDGIMAKGEPENLDVAHLVSVYDEAFHKALSSRGAIKALSEATARDGQPIVKISGKADIRTGDNPGVFVDSKSLPKDAVAADGRPYQSVDHWALRGWKFAAKDNQGRPIIVRGDMLVHPDYVDFLKNELTTPRWTTKQAQGAEKIGRFARQTSTFLKASKFIGPFHIVTEALHASFHGVVPSTHGFEIDLNDPKQALLSRNMMIDMGRAHEMYDDGIRSAGGGIWGKVPGLGKAIVRMNNFTFNEYIPKLKMKVGLAVLKRNMARYGGELTEDQIAEITGRQMDAAFGGQNWRLMGANKNVLAITRLGLVAPDFLISRAKVVGQAFRPYGAEQRRFLLLQAVGVYTLARILNSIFSDNHDPHFELKNWDSVVIGKRAYHARFLVSDAANLARDLMGLGSFNQHGIPFITGRLGVLPKMGMEVTSGKDLWTGQNKEGLFDAQNPILKAFSIVAADTAEWMTPMGVDGFLPGAAKAGITEKGAAITALVGVSSRKESPANEVWDMARQFNLNSNDPKAVNFQKQRDNDSGKPSDYRALNNLLDAGHLAQAKTEVQALQAQGKTISQIMSHYHRQTYFTGSSVREAAFYAQLSPEQKKQYQAAKAEQRDRAAALANALAE